MLEYVRLNESSLDSVVRKYVEYYNQAENGCWTFEQARKRIHQVMTMEDALCCLQYDGQRLTGFLMGYFKEFDDGRDFYIEEIVIFAGCQNKGYGTELMKHIESMAAIGGAGHVELICVNDPHHMHFYKKLGYSGAESLTVMGKRTRPGGNL